MKPSARSTWAVSIGWLIGCGSVGASKTPDAAQVDATADVALGCDPSDPFGAPQLVPGLDGAQAPLTVADASLSPDELTIYFTGSTPAGDRDIYMATRSASGMPFENFSSLTTLNTAGMDCCPAVSPDELTIFFHSSRVSGEGAHIYVAARPVTTAVFGSPAIVAGIGASSSTASDVDPAIATTDGALWFASDRSGMALEIYRAARAGSAYAKPVAVAELNSSEQEIHPTVSADLLTVYFASTRSGPGARGGFDIYRAHRSTVNDGFGPAAPVNELNTTGNDNPRWLSPDGCRLYLHSDVSGSFHIYMAARPPRSSARHPTS